MSDANLFDESHVVPDLSKSKANLKLTPLDMNMPRLYGVRWILCFSVNSADKVQIYEQLKNGLARTIEAIPWIAGNVVCSP
jgi:trichothecene 3-O-acetyltransferase